VTAAGISKTFREYDLVRFIVEMGRPRHQPPSPRSSRLSVRAPARASFVAVWIAAPVIG
jgi:hypothetical protein